MPEGLGPHFGMPWRRENPRPLGFHLMVTAMTWNGAVAGLPAFLSGLPMAHGTLTDDADTLRATMALAGPDLAGDVTDRALARIEAMLRGVRAYQAHPHVRAGYQGDGGPAIIYRNGSLRLLDFAPGNRKSGRTVVMVPSLINPSYILDLSTGRSLMRHLAGAGLRPILVDWGAPASPEQGFDVGDYVTERLEPALAEVTHDVGEPPALIGYCMGGNLALAAAVRRPDLVSALAFLATPWDFHARSVTLNRAVSTMFSGILSGLLSGPGGGAGDHGVVPVDLIQLFFASLDPTLTDRKFRRFAGLDPESAEARLFVEMEDWVNDGAPLAMRVARECVQDWYGHNLPGTNRWQVGGVTIDPASVRQPALVIAPRSDRIVPPESALALARALPAATERRASGGHVSMVVGRAAKRDLWNPLTEWLQDPA